MTAPRFAVREVRLFERPVTMRIPFRFGVITLTEAPQAFVHLRIETEDGCDAWGLAAEMIVPKWFDKSDALSNDDNLDQLRHALGTYAGVISGNGGQTAFGHYSTLYKVHLDDCAATEIGPLAAGFGPSLIDRAAMDALCRLENVSFADAMAANLAGMTPGVLATDLDGFDFDAFLASLKPAPRVHARHTVGLVDALVASDLDHCEPIDDGLPETLEDVVDRYGHSYFKLKIGGDAEADLERLTAIAGVLDRLPAPYHVTLDGNEQYNDPAAVIDLMRAMEASLALKRLSSSILFVEQPINRLSALSHDLSALAEIRPVIIDESDAELSSFKIAKDCGYAGVSSKNCKGFYKSLINLARCRMWSQSGGQHYFMSAEDLTCQAGVAVQQDLALIALLGLTHVERNGHHYVKGMAGAGVDEQENFLAGHPGLYARRGKDVCTHITGGMLDLTSLQCIGFGTAVEPDWDNMSDMDTTKWIEGKDNG